MKLLTTVVLAGLAFSANTQAASVYAVSVNKISNFSMVFNGSGSFSGFTFSNDAAANFDGGAGGVDTLDAPAACISCSYDNDFVAHSSLTDFAYGDAQILDTDILGGLGTASSIAEARESNGVGFAMGSNMLLSVNFNIATAGTSVSFNFDSDAYMEASTTGGGSALSNMAMSIVLMDLTGSTVWESTPAALNQTLTSGSYAFAQNITDGTVALDAGNYSLVIGMSQSVNVSAVPVPAALPLMLSGLLGLFGLARRRK